MKKVIASRYSDYDKSDNWTDEDIRLHKSIDWAARNYQEYEVEDDKFVGPAILYSNNGPVKIRTQFVKCIRPNPIYPPYYRPVDLRPFKDYDKYVGPMYDGRKFQGYSVHDRFESQENYDILSM